MRSNYLMYSLFIFIICGIIACGDKPTTKTDGELTTADDPAIVPTDILLSEFPNSPDYSTAELELFGYKNGTFNFGVKYYELGIQTPDAPQKMCANSAQGQHIHLIIDDQPYAAKYVADFEHPVDDGEHYLLAFLSRSYHESIKTDEAHVLLKGNFEKGTMTSSEPVETPMLFYSRPKGEYIGKENTDKIMLDFYVVNTTLSDDGNKVKVEVNGEPKFTLSTWEPVFLEGLPLGDNKIRLTLVDKDGNALNVPLNPVERVFTLKADPLENQ